MESLVSLKTQGVLEKVPENIRLDHSKDKTQGDFAAHSLLNNTINNRRISPLRHKEINKAWTRNLNLFHLGRIWEIGFNFRLVLKLTMNIM
jgi:hypothetical protein